MNPFHFRRWPLGVLAGLHVVAASATGHEQAPPPPAPSSRSALADYRPFADQAIESWIEMNEVVRRIGGWRAYAAERAAPAAEPKPDNPDRAPPPSGSEGKSHAHPGHGIRP